MSGYELKWVLTVEPDGSIPESTIRELASLGRAASTPEMRKTFARLAIALTDVALLQVQDRLGALKEELRRGGDE